jgi:Leucine-rich repeat (LRR) protein
MLNSLPDGLEQLFCSNNKIVRIEHLPSSLTRANCTGNPLISKPTCPNNLLLLNYSLDAEKASKTDKLINSGYKTAYALYHTAKYSVYGVGGIVGGVLGACVLGVSVPIVASYDYLTKSNKLSKIIT